MRTEYLNRQCNLFDFPADLIEGCRKGDQKAQPTVKKLKISNYWLLTIVLIGVRLSIYVFTGARYELLRDEMLFFNMGDHLSAGYATVPPVTGFLAFVMHHLFGYSVLGIRLFPALMGAISIYIIALLVRELGGGIQALLIAGSSYLFATGILLATMLFTPNVFDEFVWLVATLLIFRMIKKEDHKMWIPLSIVLAVGFLNKYSVLFFIAGFFLAFMIEGKLKLMKSKYFLAGILIGLAIISPNIVWQYNHNWPVRFHMSELRDSQLDLLGYSGFFTYLFSFSQGSVIIWIIGLFALLFLKREREYRYLGIASLSIMTLFFLLKGKGYYVLGLLPFLFAFAGYIMEKYLQDSRKWIKWGIFSFSLLMSVAALPSGAPVLSFDKYETYLDKTRKFISHPMMQWDNGEEHQFPQAYADMTGWKELAGIVSKAYYSLTPAEREKCTIYCEQSYGYAGAIYFYGKEYRLPQPVTFHESYVFWAPDSIPAGPMIYVFRNINGLDKFYSDVREIGVINDTYFREKGLKVFLCKSPTKDIRKIYKEKAKEEKDRFRRI